MKQLIILAFSIVFTLNTQAQLRTAIEAEQLCNQWISTLQTTGNSLYPSGGLSLGNHETELHEGLAVYYIFDLLPQGFILISAEKRGEAILGFSTENNWSTTNEKPPALLSLLEAYKQKIVSTRALNPRRSRAFATRA